MLKINNISKTFFPNTINEKVAISNLSLELNEGDFITIIGSNGAGKSTLFNLIAGSLYPDSGSIYLDNKNITFLEEHKKAKDIGRLFQNPIAGTAPHMTILENMALVYLKTKNRSPLATITNKDKEDIKAMLKQLDMSLEDRLNQPVGLLSGGQRQALTLLMATMSKPKLLLLDEHTAALDPSVADKVIKLTDKIIKENNITTLMITHNMSEALSLGNRLIMMDDGKIVLDIGGDLKKSYTVEKLLSEFNSKVNKKLDNDRMLLK